MTSKTIPFYLTENAFKILIFRELWQSTMTLNDLKDFIDVEKLAEKIDNYPAPRNCKICNKGMFEGFLFEEIGEAFCSEKCLYTEMTPEEYDKYYEERIGYWTAWTYELTEEDENNSLVNLFHF